MTANKIDKSGKRIEPAVIVVCALAAIFIILIITPKWVFQHPGSVGNVLATARIVSGIPPDFDFNLTNYTINQTDTFTLDINCTDIEFFDNVSYYTNFTGFTINVTTGLINQTGFNQSYVGNNSIKITCSDGKNNNSQTFNLEILNLNEPPVLDPIGPQIATEGELFTLQVTAFDIDGDVLSFNASTTLFTINNETGLVSFIPTIPQVGDYTINFTVFDGQVYDWEIVSFRIVRGPYCGDGSCGSEESCHTCSQDCGGCPTPTQPEVPPQTGTTGGGATSGGGIGTAVGPTRAPSYKCDEKWECSDWAICSLNGARTRKCKDINRCNTKQEKPTELETCEYIPTCFDKVQNGLEEGIDCGGPCEPCLRANCFDGLQNQGEEGVDCGGPCKDCRINKFAKLPFVEIPSEFLIPRTFPWLLILIMAAVITMTVTTDQTYMNKIKKKKFEEFRERYTKYRPTRKKMYNFAVNLPIVTIIAALHIYYFSNDPEGMVFYSWIPAIIILFVPAAVSYAIVHLAYYEYKKKRKEQMLKQTHKREILQLVRIENSLLDDMELKLKNDLYKMATQHKFEKHADLYHEINPVYSTLSTLEKNRRERVSMSKISAEAFKKILDLNENSELKKISRDYPEFMSIMKILQYIKENINIDIYDAEQDFMDEMKEISRPHMLTVIKANQKLVHLYNELIDVYNYLVDKHASSEEKDKELTQIERTFTDEIKSISKNSKLLDVIQKEHDFAAIYNEFIDLFNHYARKQELGTKIKGL